MMAAASSMSRVAEAASDSTDMADDSRVTVAACAVGLTFSLATLLLYIFGVLVRPLTVEFGWTHTQLAVALAASQYTFALSAPFWGRPDRSVWGSRGDLAVHGVHGTAHWIAWPPWQLAAIVSDLYCRLSLCRWGHPDRVCRCVGAQV